jgi:hypothetical protein
LIISYLQVKKRLIPLTFQTFPFFPEIFLRLIRERFHTNGIKHKINPFPMMYRLFICLMLCMALVGSLAAQTPVSPQTTVLQVRYKITSDLARGWAQVVVDPCLWSSTPCYKDRELTKRVEVIGYPVIEQDEELVITIDETFVWDKANRRLQRVLSHDDGIYFEIHTKTQTEFWGAFRKIDFLEWGINKNNIYDRFYAWELLWTNPYDLTDQRPISEALAARLYDGEVVRFKEGNKEELWVMSPEHFKQLFAAHTEVLQAAPPRYQFTAADAQKTKGITQFDFYRAAQKQVSPIRFEPVKRLDFGLGQVKYAIDMPALITDSLISAVQQGIIRPFESDTLITRQSYEEFMERLEYVKKAIRKKFPGQENNLGKFLKTYYSLPLRYFPESNRAAVMPHGIITDLNYSQPFDVLSAYYPFFASDQFYYGDALSVVLPAHLTESGQPFELASFSWREVQWNVFEDNPGITTTNWLHATLRLGFWRDLLTNRLVNLANPEGIAYFSQRMGQRSEVVAAVQNLQGKKLYETLNPSPVGIYPNIAAVSLDTDHPEAMEEVIASLPRLWGVSPIGKGKLPASLTKLRNLFYINLVHWHNGWDAPKTLADWQALLSLLQQTGKPVYFLNEDSNGFIYKESELKPLQQRLYVKVNDYQLYKLLQLPQLPPDCTRFIYELQVVLGADEEFPTGIISRLPYLKTLAINRDAAWRQPMPPPFRLPEQVGELTTLTRLSLSNVANLPASLATLVNLEHLEIQRSLQVDVTPLNQILPALKNLESLSLHHSQVTRLLPAVRQLTRLKELSVYAPEGSLEPSNTEIERLRQILPNCKVERRLLF